MKRDLPQIHDDLANLYDSDQRATATSTKSGVGASERALLWLLRQDLRAHVLLGDPAVHLPIPPKTEPPRPPPRLEDLFGFTPSSGSGKRQAP